jgi:hypothetical protein
LVKAANGSSNAPSNKRSALSADSMALKAATPSRPASSAPRRRMVSSENLWNMRTLF